MPNTDRSKVMEKVRSLPHTPGVYMMKDRLGSVLYVGKAKDIKRRVSSYFRDSNRMRLSQPKVVAMIPLIFDLEIIEVRSETEALILEGKLIKQFKPRYNTSFIDDKRFLLVRLDEYAILPRFRLCRVQADERSRYFGPFAHSSLLRRTLAEMRKRYGILLGDAHPELQPDGTWKLYDDIRNELYGHVNTVTPEQYHERVRQAAVFLEGKSREWLEELRAEMMKAAETRDYERAAGYRDMLQALEKTLTPTRKFARDPMLHVPSADALNRLREALGCEHAIGIIECFDISHISGTFCVASMVRFVGGQPDKSGYRRFKIQTFTGNDDFRAMHEVVGRRYTRLKEENRTFPDLVIIDGGVGQVSAALEAFAEAKLEPPLLIGLAKREETIIFPSPRPPLKLPHHDAALQLLQRVRDEAHRFANTFNAELRSKRLRESILDDFEGLGPVRRAALLDHFKTIDSLRRASLEQLQEVDGIGPILAGQLRGFLNAATPGDGTEAGIERSEMVFPTTPSIQDTQA
ncbi:MAG: excinuclease ABC subunit UvrC [Verrucomicrobiota bacterium]|nr:excinuclease ABC subunit UvrC [Verrucomicrobiota bacterium]